MNVKLYNTQRCPYARRTRIVLHEKVWRSRNTNPPKLRFRARLSEHTREVCFELVVEG
jgi:hypothetical protein